MSRLQLRKTWRPPLPQRYRRQEEEEMTSYSSKDLAEGWEFKIVRSNFAAFRKPEKLRAVLDEEKRAGCGCSWRSSTTNRIRPQAAPGLGPS